MTKKNEHTAKDACCDEHPHHTHRDAARSTAPDTDGVRKTGNYLTIGLAVLLGLLVVTAGVQAVQLTSMHSDMAKLPDLVSHGGTVNAATNSSTLDSSIDALPQQVGGC